MDERLLNPISTRELERRWAAARNAMAERKIDALVMQNNNDWLGGYVRWFTDTPLSNGYPAQRDLSRVRPDDRGRHGRQGRAAQARRQRGGQSRRRRDDLHAGLHLGRLYRRVPGRAGRRGDQAARIPHHRLGRQRRDAAQIRRPASSASSRARPRSSMPPSSSTASRRSRARRRRSSSANAREMQDEIFARVLTKIRPGMTDNEITALAQYEGRDPRQRAGAVPRLLGAARPGIAVHRPSSAGAHDQARRALLAADREQRPRRHVYRDRPHHRARQGVERADRRLRSDEGGAGPYACACSSPARPARDIAARTTTTCARRGLPAELRLYAHGQGYDLVERPLIRADETMKIEEHMNLAVHPGYETPSIFAVICDNYLIEAGGPGECLHKTPKQVFEV